MAGVKELWCSSSCVAVVHSFHEGMRAFVCVRGEFSDCFEVRNGVKQGCTVAPTSLVYTSALSLMTSVISVLRLVCPFSITMGAS